MKEAAHKYWKQGHAIVIFKIAEENKKPLVTWRKWIQGEQTEEEFNNQPWARANAFGVICGRKLKNGLYVGAVDFDVKNVSVEAISKGKKVLGKCSVTQKEQTPSGGEHLIFYSHEPVKSNKSFHDSHGLELLGESTIVIMCPSAGYTRLNDNFPTEKNDLTAFFFELLGKEKPESIWFEREDLKGKKYRGKDPSCISNLHRGTKEGLRNEHGIRLAAYLLNFRKYQPQSVLKIIKQWNKFNTPALSNAELENIIKSAIQGNYVYGCNDPILRELCNREECPISPKVVILTEEQRKKAEWTLQNVNLLDVVLSFGRRKLIGEDNALLQNFILLCSGQTKYPISGIISGFSGSGKNESLRAIKPLIPPEWIFDFTTSTPEAIKYIPEDFEGTLIIYEASGMKSKTATLGLRAIGEAESIETIYPMRDEATGKMTLGRHQTKAKNFITTESDIDIQPDLYRRVLKQSMNHSYALTKRVMAMQMRDAALPESLRQILNKEKKSQCSAKEFQNALRVQDWKAEAIVFAPPNILRLLEYASTKEQQVALRTQLKKIVYFIRVLALLHQKHRVTVKVENKKYVIANSEDYEIGLRVLQRTIMETISRIGKRQQEVLDLFETVEVLDKHKASEKLKVSTVTAARALKTLFKHGYLSEHTNNKPYTYEILREKAKEFVILEDINEYERFYRKELKNFRERILSLCQSGAPSKKFEIQEPKETLTDRINIGWKKIGGTLNKASDKVASRQESTFFFEKENKLLVSSEMISQNKSEERKKEENMFPCSFCAAFGKQIMFNSQEDLDSHVEKCHVNVRAFRN